MDIHGGNTLIVAMLIAFDLLILLTLWIIDSNTRKRTENIKLLTKEVNTLRQEIGALRNEIKGHEYEIIE